MKRNNTVIMKNIATHTILSLTAISLIIPFLWMLSGAFKDNLEVIKIPPQLLPTKFNLDNFLEIVEYFPLGAFFANSVFVSVVTTILQLLICSMAAFVFAKIRFRFRDSLFILYLITMMIPFQVRVTPMYLLFVSLGMDDTYLGLILPNIFSAFGTFLLRQHMMTIPDSYLEAAYIDGASYFNVFRRIILPLSRVALATLSVFSFMYCWNDFLWPLIIITNTRLATLPLGLAKLSGRWSTEWNILMAGNIVAFIPTLIVYLVAQKHFIKGITLGGIKG